MLPSILTNLFKPATYVVSSLSPVLRTEHVPGQWEIFPNLGFEASPSSMIITIIMLIIKMNDSDNNDNNS